MLNFLKYFKYTSTISLIAILTSLFALFYHGLNLSLEFTGGLRAELEFTHAVNQHDFSKRLSDKLTAYNKPKIQYYANNKTIIISLTKSLGQDLGNLKQIIESNWPEAKIILIDQLGPQLGDNGLQKAFFAVFLSLVGMMVYIAMRFGWGFAVSGSLGLFHDAIIVLGILSISGLEFDLTAFGAILAVIGYSLNNTIVIFDRIRDNLKGSNNTKAHASNVNQSNNANHANDINYSSCANQANYKNDLQAIINHAINQTLSRTIITSLLTLMPMVSMLIFASSTLFGFAFVLILGIIIGMYSSIAIVGGVYSLLR